MKGVTLLELLITTIVLAVGMTAIMQALSMSIFASAASENVELALGIAQAKLENIYGTTGGVSDEALHSVSAEGFSGGVYANRNFQLGVKTDDSDPEAVAVSVCWDTKGGQANITLKTLVVN